MKDLVAELLVKVISLPRSTFFMPKPIAAPMDSVIDSLPRYYSEKECSILGKLSQCQGIIVHLVKEGNLTDVEVYAAAAKYLLRQLKGECKSIGKTFVYPAFSLYAYKNGKQYLAKRYINQVIVIDDVLCTKFPILHLHKLHHLANRINTHLRSGQVDAAAKIIAAVILYLCQGTINSDYGTGNKKLLNQLFSSVDEGNVILSLYNQFFQPMITFPELGTKVLQQYEMTLLLNSPIKSYGAIESKGALIAFFNIKMDLLMLQLDQKKILDFFKKYHSYNFDILKLILLRDFHFALKDGDISKLVNQAMSNHLNFKFFSQLFVPESSTSCQHG
ncbi:hypothetical protein GCM10027594_11500 [Hymenobacter agri]